MDLLAASTFLCTSLGYMALNVKRYFDFKKFQNTGYHDDFHLLDGKVTSSNATGSFIGEFKGHQQNNVLINNFVVEVGKEKTGVNNYPVNIGKQTVFIPQPYKYIDWKTTHNTTTWVPDIFVNSQIKLYFKSVFTPFYVHCNSIKETHESRMLQLFNLFDKHSIQFKTGDKIKVTENTINNGDHLSVLGKYMSNKEMEVSYIGSRELITSAVRRNICKVNYGFVTLAGMIFAGSLAYLITNNDLSYKNKNHRTKWS